MARPALLFALLLTASAASAAPWTESVIRGEAVWRGEVEVTSPVRVEEGGRLRVEPGARVAFDVPHGVGHDHPPWVDVKGELVVAGEPGNPVRFTAAKDSSDDEDMDMFSLVGAKRVEFRHALLTGAGWAVHLHDVPGASFINCEFRSNYGGVRFKSDRLSFEGNTFAGNRIGVRAINSKDPRFTGNTFTGNLTGIFFREGIEGALLSGNLFDDEEYEVKLGEGQTFDVDARGNRWARPGAELAERIWDAEDTPGLGRVRMEEGR